MSVQQGVSQQRPKWRRGSWIRVLIFVVCSLLIIASVTATAFQFLSPLVGAILATLPILVALATWLFPLPPMTDIPSEATPSPHPIQVSVTVQAPPALPPTSGQHIDQQTELKTIWNVPYRRNLYFTGREQVLHALHERFRTAKAAALTQSQAISGLGGIGKTQVAVEYAYRHREEYRYILWVNAETRDTILTSFLELATRLVLPERHEADQNKVVAAVNRWLSEHDEWLLIFDNADDLTLAEEFLPTSDTGHLILTTRNQALGVLAESLDVEIMNKEEGTLLVMRRAKLLAREAKLGQAPQDERTQAEQIVLAMGGLPLALDQAAAYIEETRCTLSAFLEKYQRQRDDILRRRGGTGKDHPLPVTATWSLSFAEVELISPAAADLLRVCAFLAPDAIPEEMIIEGATELGPLLEALKDNATQLDEAIGTLNRFSLIRRNREERTLWLHRLVQVAQLMDMDTLTKKMWAERAICAVNQAFPQVEVATWPQCEHYLPHALACAHQIEAQKIETLEAAQLLNQIGYYLSERGQYAQVEQQYRLALAIRERLLGDNNPETASSLNNLAFFYRRQARYIEAEPLFTRALAIREQMLGLNHPDTATSLNNLAFLYRRQHKYEQAKLLLIRAIAIREQVLGPNHPDTAYSLSNLAELFRNQSKYAEAEPLYQRALAIREQVLDPQNPNTKNVRANYARLLADMKSKKQ